MHRNVIPLDSAVRIERVPIFNEHADITCLHGLFQRNGLRPLRRAIRFLGRGPLAVLDWSRFSICILELHALGLASLPIHTEGLHITRRTKVELDPSRAGSSLGRPPRFAGRSIPIDRLLARKISVLVARSGDFGLARDVGLGGLLLRSRARGLSRDIPNLELGHGHAIRTVHTRNLELDELGIDGSIELEASDGPRAALPLLDRRAPVLLVLARIQFEIGAAVGRIFPSDLEVIDLLDLLQVHDCGMGVGRGGLGHPTTGLRLVTIDQLFSAPFVLSCHLNRFIEGQIDLVGVRRLGRQGNRRGTQQQ
ncbi:Uncharacterised protein [Collinsella intestinalis]|nr:Uncharacterised protein [Collinsella intestinalis]